MKRPILVVAAMFAFPVFASAEASHPLVRPPLMIKPSKAQMPIVLTDLIEKKTVGLDFDSKEQVDLAMKQARDYIEYRKGQWPHSRLEAWSNACETNMTAQANPFCRIEQERVLSGGTTAVLNKSRSEKHALADSLKEGDFAKADAKSYGEVIAAVGSVGDVDTVVVPLAKRALAQKCVPGGLAAAMGYKIEELFPDKDAVELSKQLYRKALACGKDLAMANAAFRLGLILVWQKQYAEVDGLMRKVEAVPDASPIHARAAFWRYQAAIALKDEKAKAAAKENLLANHALTFQNLVANGDDSSMMDRVVSHDVPNVFTRSLIRPDVNSVLRAAEALDRAGSSQLAAEVLDRNVGDIGTIEPEVRLYTAAFLDRMGYSLTKFKILSSLFADSPRWVTQSTMALMFPLSYVDVVKKKQQTMDPLLFLSLMRQESAFNPEALSGVGARGLMQVMPATARTMMRVRKNQLFDPDVNIAVGTKYFLSKLPQYGGDVELTLAAYNAGFARVDQWIKRYPTDNKLLFLDFIPFRETRDYVSSILRNYYWYVRLYSPSSSEGVATTGAPLKMQSILAANAGDAARLNPLRQPTAVAQPEN